jgi:hypothetical protein
LVARACGKMRDALNHVLNSLENERMKTPYRENPWK